MRVAVEHGSWESPGYWRPLPRNENVKNNKCVISVVNDNKCPNTFK